MRAAVMRSKKIVADTVPDPVPGAGQVLVRTLACGICGSDLHALEHADEMAKLAAESGAPALMDASRDIVMGHEFCAEILDFGPSTMKKLKPGQRVCSMPLVLHSRGLAAVGYSNDFPGGYAEQMLLSEAMLLPVPDGLPTEMAALTEPMAVGAHAVAMGKPTKVDAALVVGCGPVGLAVIAALKLQGIGPIVAADFSPKRRGLAEKLGADEVIDPAKQKPMEAWQKRSGGRSALIFECVGVPGVINDLMREAPRGARIVVAGVCMQLRHDPPDVRHQQGALAPVRARLHARRVQRHPARARRRQDPGRAAHHGPRRHRRRRGGVRNAARPGGARQDPGEAGSGLSVADPEILFYDGACGLCHRTVLFVLAHDREGAFRFAPIGGASFSAAFPVAERERLPDSIVVRRSDGAILERSDAAAHLLARLGGGWRVLGALLRAIPRPIRDGGYDWVARNRKRWFPKPDDACPIVPAHLRARFVP